MLSTSVLCQQIVGTPDQTSQAPGTTVVERDYPSGGSTPSRSVQTRSVSDGREIVVETVEMPGIEGRLEPSHEIASETTRTDDSTRTTEDVFGFGPHRERILLETSESNRDASPDGSTRSVRTTWVSDPDGRLSARSRQIEESRSIAPEVHESTTTVLEAGVNELFSESWRRDETERRIGTGVIRYDSTQQRRDPNGRWQTTETRQRDSRDVGSSEQLEEETVRTVDPSGNLTMGERIVTRRSSSNGREDVVIETYAQNAEGFTADGGRETVEELETRSQVSPAHPMRVTRRTVTTVRKTGPDSWETERRVFELDVNGRMVPIIAERQETAAK
jgi:hypothetical protein